MSWIQESEIEELNEKIKQLEKAGAKGMNIGNQSAKTIINHGNIFTKKELEHIKSVYAKIYGSGDFDEAEEAVVKAIYDKVSK